MSVVGETLLSCALTEIFTKINFVVVEGISGAWKLEADLEKLRESIWRIQEAQITADDENFWKLQEVIYCAENVVDEFHYETLRREVENQLKHKLSDFVSLKNPLLFRIGMATRVKKLNKKVPLLENRGTPAPPAAANTGVDLPSLKERVTHSYLENTPFGRTREVKAIIEMLQATSSHAPPFTVVSIVGFGGLGKTFLAKLVKKEAQGKKLFDEFMWVCVSESFDCGKILREMLQKLDQNGGMQSSIDATIHHLKQKLKDKSFFLVLDDVWNEDFVKWDNLKGCLKNLCGESGNFVIVVTTRSKVVASIMESKHMVELNQLSDIECWSIIKERVVGNEGGSNISHDMEIIGMKIAKKCGGVPLAAIVLGGVLRSPMNQAEWLSIQHSNVWNEVDKYKRTSGVLKLSFDRLPPPQKLCFAYCSLFPKDFVFEKAQLIQLWMAEGFLKTTLTNGGRRAKLMEDVGEEYFQSLFVNSFFQDAQVDDLGNIVRCKMHDLLHDLASSISKSQRLQCGSDCIQTSEGRRFNCSCRHWRSKIQETLESSEDKTRNSRSLFCRADVSLMMSNFRRLRSLDMSGATLKNLPAAIGKLKHLRFLDISKNETIQALPQSLTKLYNLQTFRVFKCRSLKELPSEIRNLVSLRHIGFDDKRLMPLKVGGLTNLQTLPFFFVGLQEGQTINELEELKELRGELVICNLENVRDKGEAERAKIKEKKLSKFELQWMEVEKHEVENICSTREGNHEEVMEGIGAPTNTQSLTAKWYMGKQFPKWMSELKELVNLTLQNCRRSVTMPTLGHLPNLKILRVERMDSMKIIGGEFYGESNNVDTLFPSLEEFCIRKMKSLVEWVSPKGTEIFPKLRDLWIEDCPNLTSFPLSQSTSSAISMRLHSYFTEGGATVEILCFTDFKSLEGLQIRRCPKLTFLHIGFKSLPDFLFFSRNDISYLKDDLVKNLSECSNELGESCEMMRIEGAIELIREFPKSLEALEIEKFSNLSVEAFHGLSCLKHLVISWCDSLESIPTLSSLTSLQHLEITHCCTLESIPSLSSLTSLEHLEINGCPRLQSIPSLSSLNSLKYLRISYNNCDRLESIPTTCLEELHIWVCHNLRSVPSEIKLCTSLKVLRVAYCRELVSIDDDVMGSLTQLKELEWGGFSEELDQLPGLNLIRLLTSLQKLNIIGWEKLTSLPHQLQHLTSITRLTIQHFDGVKSLPDWFCNFSSLQSLTIFYCKNLKNFTTDMHRLSKLTSLDTWGCPLLAERCAIDIGPEWSNISHIPCIQIESMRRYQE